MANLPYFPLAFYLCVGAILFCFYTTWQNRHQPWGPPMAMVLGTVAVWYLGDAIYNDYYEYIIRIGDAALAAAWWQVLWFLAAFALLVPTVHGFVNARFHGAPSRVVAYVETRAHEHPHNQDRLDRLTISMLVVWCLLMSAALVRTKFDVVGMFAPYLGAKAHPWARGRMGEGLDAVLSLAGYVQILLAAGFGVVAAISRRPRTLCLALIICALTLPFYIFDRTRNTMLATAMPGFLALVFLRLRGGMITKGAVLVVGFMVVQFWFAFVIANRTSGSIARAFNTGQGFERVQEDTKHQGISMFSELGFMNDFFSRDVITPSWGGRYFAELVNPIPRSIWAGKPTVGIDYANARGFGKENSTGIDAGVSASIASGLIGQGVLNFGRLFGPLAAALLMSLWVAVLARQDLLGEDPGRLLLYAVGMVLTFNMGRDITLLVLYPFLFGWLLLQLRNLLTHDEVRKRVDVPQRTVAVVGYGRGRRRGPAPAGPQKGPWQEAGQGMERDESDDIR